MSALGVLNHHACPDWEKGIPDRYVIGGRWIEFKSLAYEFSAMPWNAFSQAQKDKLDEYESGGDRCWVAVLLCHEDDGDLDRVILMRWPEFKDKYRKVSIKRETIIQTFPILDRREPNDMRNLAASWNADRA